MKKTPLFKYSLLLLASFATLVSVAKDQEEKKKYVEKSFEVSANTRLQIENKFGKVEVRNWDQSSFAVKVEIIGKGSDEESAQRILDDIQIEIDENDLGVFFTTVIDSRKNKKPEGFEVNYTIKMPIENPLHITNSFGNVAMGDREGELYLSVKYGAIKVGNVSEEAEIKLSFGSGSVGSMSEGEVTVKYSSLEIEGAKALNLTQAFSDVELGSVEDLDLESKYGDVEIESAHKIDAEVGYSAFEIETLTGSLELDCSFLGDFKIERLAKSFTLLDIDGKYGSYDVGLEPGLNADIDAEFSFANLKYTDEVDVDFSYRVKESNKQYYKGKIGKGDPNKLIKIDSGFGNLRLKVD